MTRHLVVHAHCLHGHKQWPRPRAWSADSHSPDPSTCFHDFLSYLAFSPVCLSDFSRFLWLTVGSVFYPWCLCQGYYLSLQRKCPPHPRSRILKGHAHLGSVQTPWNQLPAALPPQVSSFPICTLPTPESHTAFLGNPALTVCTQAAFSAPCRQT